MTESSVEKFKELMSTVDWNLITQTLNPNNSFNIFIGNFQKFMMKLFFNKKSQ